MDKLTLLNLILLAHLLTPQGCIEGELQLQPNTTPGFNRTFLHYCFSTTWRRVCQLYWDQASAEVACRQLGYSDQGPIHGLYCDSRNQLSVRLYGSCDGTENRLYECEGLQNIQCVICDYVWLECTPNCAGGEVRLMNGSTNSEGRVEVCVDGHWGTVCNRGQERAAKVVCSLLGFVSGLTATETFHPGLVPISNCTVQGRQNLSCSQLTDASCNHSMDLAVQCFTDKQYMELISQHATTTISMLITKDECVTEVIPGARAIIIALAVTAGVLMVLLLGALTALLLMCIKRGNANASSPPIDQPITTITDNPAYEVIKQSEHQRYYEPVNQQ